MRTSYCPHQTAIVGFLSILLIAVSANAATFVVNSASDDGIGTCTASKCTLRDALVSAATGDTITFSLPANSAIMLTNGQLLINKNLRITGPGANLLTVQRSAASGTPNFGIFAIAPGVDATISKITVANGNAPGQLGGGISNAGTLTLVNSTISGNSASAGGGGISATGTTVIINSTVSGNSAGGSNGGGGIFNTGNLTITNSTISGNTAHGARGVGGGVQNNGPATISNSTISGNSADTLGGIDQQGGTMTITNSTISGNMASLGTAGGVYIQAGAVVTVRNTIIAKNTIAAPSGNDVSGSLTSQGFNLIGNNSDATITPTTGDQIGTPASPIDPMLGPLQDNGGPTKTQAPLSGSRAIDKGDSGGSSTDQRGFTRPVDSPIIANGGDGSDVGAYEVQPDQLDGCRDTSLVVNDNGDSGAGSLRSVISSACPGSTITFAPNVRGAINLTSGELLINKNLKISGPGANLLSVQRSTASGTSNFRVFNISPAGVNASISGLTTSNGSSVRGAGVSNSGTLNLTNTAISGNSAIGGNGGGVYNDFGFLTITGSTISGNTVSSAFVAGSGGGIFNSGGTILITSGTLSGNSAIGPGGNSDSGGGIFNNGGAVFFSSSTVTENLGDLGGGIRNLNGGSVFLRNTIIALNTSPSGSDVNGAVTSNGFNIIGDSSGATIPKRPDDQIGVTAAQLNLGPLQSNGGPTQTRALLSGSVAIDKGNSEGLTTDQRGFVRPVGTAAVSGGDGSDIGAFEVQATLLANISTRLRVETGDNVLIGGFILTGPAPKKIIVLAIGPSLNLQDKLADPILELYQGNTLIEANDNWVDSPNKQAIIDSTIAPTSNLESAIVRTLPANGAQYTAIVRGANNSTGIGVVQAYDLDTSANSKLANISTRGFVSTGDNVLFAGTIVVGPGTQKVIIRALGPSTGVTGAMADPTLELHDGNGALLEANDNWVDSPNKQAIIDSTIPPPNNLESAIVRTLPPANYTAIVRGAGGTTGIAVVEVYALN